MTHRAMGSTPPSLSLLSYLAPAFPGTMPASPAITAAAVMMHVVVYTLTIPQSPHHFMVLVAQNPRQKK